LILCFLVALRQTNMVPMSKLLFGLQLHSSAASWHDGIDSIKVLTPSDNLNWREFYEEMKMDQFSDKRWAVLLTSGEYPNADIGVGFYTSIIGVGSSRAEVIVNSFYAEDGPVEALQNFWRSVEGLTTTNKTITWATSQATPVRRVAIEGDLNLASGPTGWASGGYLSDAVVHGRVTPMTQQQYFFRSCHFEKGVDTSNGVNFAIVGSTGDLEEQQGRAPKVSVVPTARHIAEKPFLVEVDGAWHIAVPAFRSDAMGPSDESDIESRISMEDVFVAKDGDTAETINAGIAGKLALLMTPAIYGLETPIQVTKPGFVVLGIGMPTLVNYDGRAALEVLSDDVRVAGLTFEAGSVSSETLVLWSGDGGVFSDAISRTGTFSYERIFHKSCAVTSQDVHVAIMGSNLVIDNTWIWHADHDDCGGTSDSCFSGHGILVEGDDVIGFGIKVEHTMNDLLQWNGERGTVYFFQSELPYNTPTFGEDRFAGYAVGPNVQRHEAVAVGVYIVGGLNEVKAIHVPKSTNLTNAVAWCINCPAQEQFDAIVCAGSNMLEDGECYNGDCEWDKCRISSISSAGPPAHTSSTVIISLPEAGLCVELPGGIEDDGTKIRAVACDELKTEQQWVFRGRQVLHHAVDGSDKCLDLDNGGLNDEDMQIWYCVGTPQQQWGFEKANEKIFLAQEEERCLTVGEPDELAYGLPIKVHACSGSSGQMWRMTEVTLQSVGMVV